MVSRKRKTNFKELVKLHCLGVCHSEYAICWRTQKPMIFSQRHVLTGDAILCLQCVAGTYLEQNKQGGKKLHAMHKFFHASWISEHMLCVCQIFNRLHWTRNINLATWGMKAAAFRPDDWTRFSVYLVGYLSDPKFTMDEWMDDGW